MALFIQKAEKLLYGRNKNDKILGQFTRKEKYWWLENEKNKTKLPPCLR